MPPLSPLQSGKDCCALVTRQPNIYDKSLQIASDQHKLHNYPLLVLLKLSGGCMCICIIYGIYAF